MILPVEEAYVMLNKYQLTFNDGNAERVDTISYSWKLLKQQVSITFCFPCIRSVVFVAYLSSQFRRATIAT